MDTCEKRATPAYFIAERLSATQLIMQCGQVTCLYIYIYI